MKKIINNIALLIRILLISCFCLSLSSWAATTDPQRNIQQHHPIKRKWHPSHHHRHHRYHPRYHSTKRITKKSPAKRHVKPHYHNHHSATHAPVITATEDKPNLISDNNLKNNTAISNDHNIPTPSFTIFERNRVMTYVHTTLNRLRYSRYKLGGTYFNLISGVYKVDCSEYVDQLLRNAVPEAYHHLVACVRTPRPTSEDYYVFLSSLLSDQEQQDWYRIESVANLEPGDIIVFRYKKLYFHRASGHVMVVVNTPVLERLDDNVYLVRVSDSAPSGHSDDTRPPHTSGIGEGTLLLKVDPQSGLPYAYAWKVGAPWEYDMDFAMGRPSAT